MSNITFNTEFGKNKKRTSVNLDNKTMNIESKTTTPYIGGGAALDSSKTSQEKYNPSQTEKEPADIHTKHFLPDGLKGSDLASGAAGKGKIKRPK